MAALDRPVRRVSTRPASGGGPVDTKRVTAPRPRDVEVYEIQTRDLLVKPWKPASIPWSKKDGSLSPSTQDFPLPEQFQWNGDWRVDTLGDGTGSRDSDGWEYATTLSRLGPHRIPRHQTMKDHARRRRWVRQMVQIQVTNEKSSEEKLAAIRAGLEMLGKAQREVEKMGRRIGTPSDTLPVRETITEYLNKVKQAQSGVLERINALRGEDDAKAQKLRREFDKIAGSFAPTERNILRQLQATPLPQPSPNAPSTEKIPKVDSGAANVQSGSGGVFFQSSESTGGAGAYVSRAQQEQQVLGQLRTLDNEEIDVAIMEERNEAIKAVHQNVVVLNSLFKDMAQLVSEQQEGINAIENNVASAHQKTKQGVNELEQALEHQKSTCVIS